MFFPSTRALFLKAENLANHAMSQQAQKLCLLCHENEQHIFNVK